MTPRKLDPRSVSTLDEKYTFVLDPSFSGIACLRHGEAWMVFHKGCNAIHSLAYDFDVEQKRLTETEYDLGVAQKKILKLEADLKGLKTRNKLLTDELEQFTGDEDTGAPRDNTKMVSNLHNIIASLRSSINAANHREVALDKRVRALEYKSQ